jgi:uncharacterized membrane protein YhiD involved in acid resistance
MESREQTGFSMNPRPATSNRHVAVQFGKLAAYFAFLLVLSYVVRVLFAQVDLEAWAGFKKVTDLINSTANVTAKRDDIIVAAYSLFLTLLGVIPVGWVYTVTKEEEGYDQSLVQTLIVLSLTVCGVMLMLQDSLARAFGFLGVVGAVRYRNTLRDPKDAVFVFVALGIGMGCGLGVYHVAGLLTLVLCVVFLVMWTLKTGQSSVVPFRSEKPAKEKKDKEKKDKSKKEKKKAKLDDLLANLSEETQQTVRNELNPEESEITARAPKPGGENR